MTGNTDLRGMIPFVEYVLTRLHNSILLPWRNTNNIQAQTLFKNEKKKCLDNVIYHSVSKQLLKIPNVEYWNTQMTVKEVEPTNQTIYIKAMKIRVTNTAVEVDPSEKTFKENLYRGGEVLTL